MRNWLIYEPPGGALPTLDGAERFVTLREGFSKLAFIVPLIWLAWRRCWLALGVYVVVEIVLSLAVRGLGLSSGAALVLAFLPNLAVGLEAAWLRARALERRGFTLVGAMPARTREEAEAVFFQDWVRQPAPERAPAAQSAPYRPTGGGVLGLFPEPGAAR
ncbi:DUF2628 domain-containing protein [Hansschlegelia plantiphila]|uniref:DUF2628 domain-containing protein n=1 Tax=Hansschlegelia plantiphila TaxID=374655 RepID=A0A9W6MWA6_9HYPH|nr:DUF2628 domain-containing protein [Hansschlegelia plantiphila]GLK68622.1 hypothetical protein GCM10008179_22600 [Hansschlegelia plantiphila]